MRAETRDSSRDDEPSRPLSIEALIPCRAVQRSGPTRDLRLEGVFNVVRARWFPVLLPSLEVFVRVRGGRRGRGRVAPTRLILGSVPRTGNPARVLARRSFTLVFEPAGEVHDFSIGLGEVWLHREGPYDLRLIVPCDPAAGHRGSEPESVERTARFEAVAVCAGENGRQARST